MDSRAPAAASYDEDGIPAGLLQQFHDLTMRHVPGARSVGWRLAGSMVPAPFGAALRGCTQLLPMDDADPYSK